MSKGFIVKNVTIIVLGILIIMSSVLFVGVSYSKEQLTASSKSIITSAWVASFSNVKTVRQHNILDEDISGPKLKKSSADLSFNLNLAPNSEYTFTVDLVNNSPVVMVIEDLTKLAMTSSNELADDTISYKAVYKDGTDINIEDTLEPGEKKTITISVKSNEYALEDTYSFTFDIKSAFRR